jgi:uncharacterized Fe-S cluster protein YjdI
MPIETIRYTKDDTTVLWKPNKCIHCGYCAKGLPTVFNPAKRPWVNMEGAPLAEIVAQVAKCPSGALSIEGKT